jgi:hypothetical protein
MKNSNNWSKFLIEFISVFIAVVFAFYLNNWNDNRKDNNAEMKILDEISNGLTKDLDDIKLNIHGHEEGIIACKYWRKVINNTEFSQDSVLVNYLNLTRDFVSINNKAGYETLKSKGLELIKNDSLRLEIISLYEYDFKTLEKLEETYSEMQFQNSYYKELNEIISPFLVFENNGNINALNLPIDVNKKDQNIFLAYLWKIEMNRNFILYYYSEMKKKTRKLISNIETELKQ